MSFVMINLSSSILIHSVQHLFSLSAVSVFWGYHKQGSCQAGLSAAVTKVNINKFLLYISSLLQPRIRFNMWIMALKWKVPTDQIEKFVIRLLQTTFFVSHCITYNKRLRSTQYTMPMMIKFYSNPISSCIAIFLSARFF